MPKADLAQTAATRRSSGPSKSCHPFNPYEHPKPTDYVQRPNSPGTRDGKPRKVPRLCIGVGRNSIDGDLGAGLKKPSPGPGSYEIAASDASQAPGRKGTYFSARRFAIRQLVLWRQIHITRTGPICGTKTNARIRTTNKT